MLLGCALLQTLVRKKCISSLKSCYEAKRDETKKLPFFVFLQKRHYKLFNCHVAYLEGMSQ